MQRVYETVASAKEIVVIRFRCLERDHSLSKRGMTLKKDLRS